MNAKTCRLLLILSIVLSGCALDQGAAPVAGTRMECAPSELPQLGLTSTGTARAFRIDPMIASANPLLTPYYLGLDRFARSVPIGNLGGFGVLTGSQVDVLNGYDCDVQYGAYSAEHKFDYSYGDPRFAEAMTYAWSDRYLNWMDERWGVQSGPTRPLTLIARCPEEDNAYYVRQSNFEYVCLGIATAASGANFTDDAEVMVHEIQHGFNVHAYPSSLGLNQFRYDEGGALNEAVADAMALVFAESEVAPTFDPRVFSRWALGSFWVALTRESHARGAHLCPSYDPRFPNCAGGDAFSAAEDHLSYIYPDGLGWPYPDHTNGTGKLRSAYLGANIHEIHNNAILLSGAIWDVYQALQNADTGLDARASVAALVQESLALLPIPSNAHLAPVTYRAFARAMVQAATDVLRWRATAIERVKDALATRGLWDRDSSQLLSSGWLALGPGAADAAGVVQSPGVHIEDNPALLRGWLSSLGASAAVKPAQGLSTGTNGKLNSGELAAVWIDLKNLSVVSAGGVLLDVEIVQNEQPGQVSSSPALTFVDGRASAQLSRDPLNFGRISSTRAQILYPKIHGSRIVSSLSSTQSERHVPISNRFFGTDLRYAKDATLALWVQVAATAQPGTRITLRATVQPTNGPTEVISVPVVIW